MADQVSSPFRLPDFRGRVALVTGASRGIDKALALRLAEAGCAVGVAAKSVRSRASLPGSIHETVAEIEARGGRALALQVDVRDPEQIERMAARTVEQLGRLDFMIHNAGALWWRPVLETPLKRYELVMQVNLRASFLCAQAVLPHMIERGSGHVLLMSPPIDLEILHGKTAYLISKYGMTMLALGLGAEVREHGVAVNALWPATAIESQATIHHRMGGPEQWRKPLIVADAACAILQRSAAELSGESLVDEDVLRAAGVDDFEHYNCVPGGSPLYIVGERARHLVWKERGGA